MQRIHLCKGAALALLLAVALPFLSKAQDTLYWTGASDSLWSNAANWSASSGGSGGAGTPTDTTVAIFDGGGTADCHVGGNGSAGTLDVTSGYSGTLYIDGTGGVFSVSGSMAVGGGTVAVLDSVLSVGDSLYLGSGGTVSDSGKVLLVAGNLSMDGGTFYGLGGHAYYNGAMHLYGGSYISSHDLTFYGGMNDPDGVFQPLGGTAYANGSGSFSVLNGFNGLVLADSTIDTLNSDLIILDRLTLGDASILRLNETNPLYSLGVQLYLLGDPTSLSPDGTSGIMVPDDNSSSSNYVAWHVGDGTGTYSIPFISQGGDRTTVSFEVQVPGGDGDGLLFFSTFPTDASANPNNQPYPVGTESFFDGLGGFYPEYAVDRYWLVGAFNYSYGSPPKGRLALQYAAADMGGTNTISEGALRLMAYDGGSTLDTVIGTVDTATHTIAVDSLQLFNPYTIVLLYDSAGIGKVFPPDSIPPQWACSDTDVAFTFDSIASGIGGDQIEWSLDSTFGSSTIVFSPATVTVTVASGSRATIWVRGRNSVSGHVSAAIHTTATVYPSATVSVTPADTIVILGQTVTLRATGTGSFGWPGLGGTADTADAVPTADSTRYTATLTDSNGCTATDTSLVRTMAFPTITVVNMTDTIESGDSTDIMVYYSVPGTAIDWSRDNTTDVLGLASGTGERIRVQLSNTSTTSAKTTTFSIQGNMNGYYTGIKVTSVVVMPKSLGLDVAVLNPSFVTACSDSLFGMVLANSGATAAFTVRLLFGFPPNGFYLTDTTDFGYTVSGDTAFVTTKHPFSGTDTLYYSLHVPCSAIPNSNAATTFAQTISVTDTNGGPFSTYTVNNGPPNGPQTISTNLHFPYLNKLFANGFRDTLVSQVPDTVSVEYRNSGNADFNGAISFDGASASCPDSTLHVSEVLLFSGTTLVADVVSPVFPIVLSPIPVPANGSLFIREVLLGTDCVPTSGCKGVLVLHWGCDTADLCHTVTIPDTVVRIATAYNVTISRISPAPIFMDSRQTVWDTSCTGNTTDWEYVVANNGSGPVTDVAISIYNGSIPGSYYTYVPMASVSIDTDLTRFPMPQPLTSFGVLHYDTLQAGDFSGTPSNCFQSYSGLLLKGFYDTVPLLLPGQKVVVRFQTYRCCPDDNPFNNSFYLNEWQQWVSFRYGCGGAVGSGQGEVHPLYVAANGTDTTRTYNAGCCNSHYIAQDGAFGLVQAFHQSHTDILGAPSCGGPPEYFDIRNSSFTSTALGRTDMGYQVFSTGNTVDASGNLVGLDLAGQFKVEVLCQTGLAPDGATPTIYHNGMATVWTAASWNTTTGTAIFDLADLPSGITSNSDSFKLFFEGSYFHFGVRGCCPISGSAAPGVTVNTYFDPEVDGHSCTTCWIPLAQVTFSLNLHCPGCRTPGMIVYADTLLRHNYGYEDGDNDGLPDGTALAPVTPAYAEFGWIDRQSAIVGDTLAGIAHGFFEDGYYDATAGWGFGYADWQAYWSSHSWSGSPATPALTHWYLQQKVTNANSVGLSCQKAWLDYTHGGATVTDTFLTSPLSPNTGDYFVYSDSAGHIAAGTVFEPGDTFVVHTLYTICGNPSSLTLLTADTKMFLTELAMPLGPLAGYPQVGSSSPVAADISPDDSVLYYCEGSGSVCTVDPIKTVFNLVADNHAPYHCDRKYDVEAGYYVASPGANTFPYEYRPMPGTDPANGPTLSNGDPVTLVFHLPHDFRATIDSAYTLLYTYDVTGGAHFVQTSVKQDSPVVLLPTDTTVNGDVVLSIMANTAAGPITYSPPFASLGFNPQPSNPYANQYVAIGGDSALLLGDEYFLQHIYLTLSPRCDSALAAVDMVPYSDIYCLLPGSANSCSTANYTLGMTGTGNYAFPLHVDSTTVVTVDSPLIVGSHATWKVTFDTAVGFSISNMVLFMEPHLADSLGVDSVAGYNCSSLLQRDLVVDTIRDTVSYFPLVIDTLLDSFYRYTLGGDKPFCIGMHINSCDSVQQLPFVYSWSCDGIPDTFPPGRNFCSTPDTVVLTLRLDPVVLATSDSVSPGPYSSCDPIRYKACITNGSSSGAIGTFLDSIRLPNGIAVDPYTVHLTAHGHDTLLPPANVLDYVGTDSTLWVFDTRQITALDSASSIFGRSGLLISTGAMCISFNISAGCHDSVIPRSVFTFVGKTYCGDTLSATVPFDSIPLNGNHCGPYITQLRTNGSCGSGPVSFAYDTVPGRTGIDTVIWSPYMPNFSSPDTGTYIVTVVDSEGCSATDTLRVSSGTGITLSITHTNDTCKYDQGAYATVAASGGSGTYHYLWSNGVTTDTAHNLMAGPYTVTVTDDSGCIAVDSVIVDKLDSFSLSVLSLGNSFACYPGSVPVISIVTDTVGTVTYVWSSGQTTSGITVSSPGTYVLTGTDGYGCTASDGTAITGPNQALNDTIVIIIPPCGGGTATAFDSVWGGTPPYTFLWNTLATTDTVGGLLPDSTYSVLVTDHNGCTVKANVTVPGLDTLAVVGPDYTCDTGWNTCYVVDPDSSHTYTWTVWGDTLVDTLAGAIIHVKWDYAWGVTHYAAMVTDSDPACGTVDTAWVDVTPCCAKGTGNETYTVKDILLSQVTPLLSYTGHANRYQTLPIYPLAAGGDSINSLDGLFIDGTLTIDTDLTIVDCPYIWIAPNSKIVVQGGRTLTLETTGTDTTTLGIGLQCDSIMWQGIVLEPGAKLLAGNAIVRDADTAIYSQKGMVELHGTHIVQNYNGVFIDSAGAGTPLLLDGAIIANDTLTEAPHTMQRGHIGLLVHGVDSIKVGSHAYAMNTFQGWDTAVCLIATGGVVANDSIAGDTLNYYKAIDVGVGARNNGYLTTLPIGPSTNYVYHPGPTLLVGDTSATVSNRLNYCRTGIRAANYVVSSFDASRNKIVNLPLKGYGIMVISFNGGGFLNAVYNHFVQVHDNSISNGAIGIMASENGAAMTIRNNSIDMDNPGHPNSTQTGIFASNKTMYVPQHPTHNTPPLLQLGDTISDNTITNAKLGIYCSQRQYQNVLNNIVNIVGSSGTAGIKQIAANGSLVSCNMVTGTDSTNEKYQFGLQLDQGGSTTAQCNQLSTLGRAIDCDYPSSPVGTLGWGFVTLKNNRMETSAVGIGLDNNCYIGDQGLDSVVTSGIPPLYFTREYTGTNDNEWRGSFPRGMIRTYYGSNSAFPYDQDSFFVRQPSGTFLDPPIMSNTDGGFGARAVGVKEITPWLAMDSCSDIGCSTVHLTPLRMLARAYTVLLDTMSFPDDSLVYRWWNRYNLYIALVDADTSVTNDTLVSAFIDTFQASATGQLLNIRMEMDTSDLADTATYDSISAELDGITTDNDMDYYMKAYASDYLYAFRNGLEGDVVGAVNGIASQCVFNGGPAVLEARALLIQDSLDLLAYDWDSTCSDGGGYKRATQINDTAQTQPKLSYELIPNLYRDNFMAKITLGDGENGEVRIYAMDGRLMGLHSITSGNNQLNLGSDGLTGGVYIYHVVVNGQIKNNGKLVVVH